MAAGKAKRREKRNRFTAEPSPELMEALDSINEPTAETFRYLAKWCNFQAEVIEDERRAEQERKNEASKEAASQGGTTESRTQTAASDEKEGGA